jgi:hypothetical protein
VRFDRDDDSAVIQAIGQRRVDSNPSPSAAT